VATTPSFGLERPATNPASQWSQTGEMPLRPLRWVAVSAVGLSLFMSALDGTIVALALPSIAGSLNLSDSFAAWLFLSYALPLTILVVPSGAVVKRLSTLPTFAISVVGFGVASLVCGLATELTVMLLGRAIQGSFAALISTQGFAVAGAIVSPKERGRAMGLLGTIAPLGGIAGPGVGGLLIATFGWPSIFFVNVPVCLCAVGLGIVSLGGFRLPNWGEAQKSVFAQMVGLIRHTRFAASLLAFFFSVTTSVSLYYVIPFDLGGIQGLPPSLSGAVLLCVPLGMMATGMIGGYLTDRYQSRRMMLLGAALILVGAGTLSLVVTSRTSELDLAWRLLVLGFGIGLFSTSTSTMIMGFGGRESMAAASSLTNLAARLGSVAGPVAVGATWASIAGLSNQIMYGILLVDGLALLTLLSASVAARNHLA
jgi:MFS transporter, DHA2 family, multidrug resistance protein